MKNMLILQYTYMYTHIVFSGEDRENQSRVIAGIARQRYLPAQ